MRKFGTIHYLLIRNVYHRRLFAWVERRKHPANWLDYLKDIRSDTPRDQWVQLIWERALIRNRD